MSKPMPTRQSLLQPWSKLGAEYVKRYLRIIGDTGRTMSYQILTTILLLTIPSASGVKSSVTFLRTEEDTTIFRECGLKGRWTFFWAKIVVFGWALTAFSVELLQIASFSRGSVSTALLLLAIVVAFKSLLTSLLYCWYLYNTRLARDLAAWKQLVAVIGDAAMAIMISLPIADLVWAVILLCLSFAASYACPTAVCVSFSDVSPRIALIGPPLLGIVVIGCYVAHAWTIANVLRRYHVIQRNLRPVGRQRFEL